MPTPTTSSAAAKSDLGAGDDANSTWRRRAIVVRQVYSFPEASFDREQPFDRLVMEGLMMDALTYVRAMPDRRDQVSREQLLNRVRAEFEEMPCLRLTRIQAQRLFGLRSDVCARVLETLVAQHALCREGEDRYRFYDQTERRSGERLRSQAS